MGEEGKEEGVKVKATYIRITVIIITSFMITTIIIMITIIITATVPSSKVVPRLAGCPSVTLRGTSYQCRSFMK